MRKARVPIDVIKYTLLLMIPAHEQRATAGFDSDLVEGAATNRASYLAALNARNPVGR